MPRLDPVTSATLPRISSFICARSAAECPCHVRERMPPRPWVLFIFAGDNLPCKDYLARGPRLGLSLRKLTSVCPNTRRSHVIPPEIHSRWRHSRLSSPIQRRFL